MRGYAPTALAPDGNYQVGALVRDVLALHDVLGGDERAVLIGHDWGAVFTYATGSFDAAPVPAPGDDGRHAGRGALRAPAVPARLLADRRLVLRQSRMSWYMAFQVLLPGSLRAVPAATDPEAVGGLVARLRRERRRAAGA